MKLCKLTFLRPQQSILRARECPVAVFSLVNFLHCISSVQQRVQFKAFAVVFIGQQLYPINNTTVALKTNNNPKFSFRFIYINKLNAQNATSPTTKSNHLLILF